MRTSLKQIFWGNYAEDVNLGGVLGQVGLGFLGVDVLADIRDLIYDVTHFEVSTGHIVQTLFDVLSMLPVIGALKYMDEAGDVLKGAIKHGDDAAKAVKKSIDKLLWDSWQTYEKVNRNGQEYAKIGDRLYSKHAVNRMQPSGNRFGPNIYQGLNGKDYGRSIAPQYVEEVINSTEAVFQPETGNFVHTLGTVKVIVNSEGAVVTIITYQ